MARPVVMKKARRLEQAGNVLLCTLCTILVVSLIGGSVLLNCTTRFNVSSNQVRGWKEALQAAEAGGDIAYAEVRKTVLDPSNAFLGWTNSGTTHSNSPVTLGTDNLVTNSTIDAFYYDVFTGNPWYRIRTKGTAPVRGLRRTGMDDRMITGARGDSILRKIDFNYDHFIATYGPNGDGTGKSLVSVPRPQVTRRIEQIAAAITPFEAAIKCIGTFYGLGDAAVIDSYDSRNGPYYFCATHQNDPYFGDSRSGNVEIDSAVATIRGWVYGDVATNGGTIVRSQYITGTIDNNVPFSVPPFYLPRNLPLPQPSPATVTSSVTINPPAAGTAANPSFYLLSALSGQLTVNSFGTEKTYVAIHVTSDVTGSIDIKPQVQLKVFVDGSMDVKGRDIINESGIAANLQYYAISPTNPATPQHVNINPPGNFAAVFYAPGADVSVNGNPDLTGAVVCKTFYANGNVMWHYDRELGQEGDAVDYRITSYVEDIR
jgi:Tfp pilus assembly protein PilX